MELATPMITNLKEFAELTDRVKAAAIEFANRLEELQQFTLLFAEKDLVPDKSNPAVV